MSKISTTASDPATSTAADSVNDKAPQHAGSTRSRKKRELIYAASALLAGFVVLPILIYVVGVLVLGPYAGGKTFGDFFAEFYRNLGRIAPRTWFIALSPYLAFWLVRLALRRWGPPSGTSSDAPQTDANAQPASGSSRREPFIGA